MNPDDVAFIDVPASTYPFTVEIFHGNDEEGEYPLFKVTVEGPGALTIPPLRRPGDPPCWTRVTYPDQVSEVRPD